MKPNRKKFVMLSVLNAFTFLLPAILFLMVPDIFTVAASSLMWIVGQAVLYKRYYVGVKPRYPLGVADPDDAYFPRFNIPRPLYLDERERRRKEIEQEQRTDVIEGK